MQCFVYKSLKKRDIYLYVTHKDDFSRVPEVLVHSLGRLELVIDLQLSPERKLAQVKAAKVMASLNEQGYFLQLPPTTLEAPFRIQ
ncbi:MAG: YcgL domain-containing protein [Gammaproteobacteria bacterium]